jgi:hypothetical protein
MKGLPVASVQNGKWVQLWLSSPNGDSSDSKVVDMECLSEQQASDLCATWNIIIKNIDEVVVAGTTRPLIRV